MSLGARLARAALTRGVALTLSMVCTLCAGALVIRTQGVEAFAAITLLSSLAALMPYADLGVGTAVVNAASDWDDESAGIASLEVVLRACIRLTLMMAVFLTTIALVLFGTGGWSSLLGAGAFGIGRPQLAATLLVVLVAASVPMGLGQRVLLGLSQVTAANALQCAASVVSLGIAIGVTVLRAPTWGYVIAPAAGTLVAAILMTFRAIRLTGVPWAALVRGAVPTRVYGSALSLGIPTVVIFTAAAVSFQFTRVLLSHLGTAQDLAQYALVAPIWLGMTSIVSVAGQLLWPHYRKLRYQEQVKMSDLVRHVRLFGLIGVGGGLAMLLIGPVVISVQTSGRVSTPWATLAAAATLLVAQSLILPLAMLMTAPSEWCGQALITVMLAVISTLIALMLCPRLGAPGAYLSGALAVFAWQFPAIFVFARYRLRRGVTRLPIDELPERTSSIQVAQV
jgi:O-antigen/teichoic acid export membrane protein